VRDCPLRRADSVSAGSNPGGPTPDRLFPLRCVRGKLVAEGSTTRDGEIESFKPGHGVHPIQANKALGDRDSWRPADLVEIGDGFLEVGFDDGTTAHYRCARAGDLAGRLRRAESSWRASARDRHRTVECADGAARQRRPSSARTHQTLARLRPGRRCGYHRPRRRVEFAVRAALVQHRAWRGEAGAAAPDPWRFTDGSPTAQENSSLTHALSFVP